MRKQYVRKPRVPRPYQFRGTYTDWGVRYFEQQRRLNPNHDRIPNIISFGVFAIFYILILWGKLH